MAACKQLFVLAVYIAASDPHVGHAVVPISDYSASLNSSVGWLPPASKTLEKPIFQPRGTSASIAPSDTQTDGMLRRAAAINIPGTTLSQFGMNTIASKGVAIAVASMESAMILRVTKEYFIPMWFIAKPSQIPIVLNSIGTPPALRIPSFTAVQYFSSPHDQE